MSNRTERREAERLARKLAYQQLRQQPAQAPISEAQLEANRANAQHSTGPSTPEGKATSSQNALKHGLTGKTVLLPNEDPAEYQQLLDDYHQIHKPVGTEEQRLVQCIVDCNWRLTRIQRLETSILYKAQVEIAEKHQDRPETERRHFVHAEAYLAYEKQLRNLNIQEARLRRTMEKSAAELKQLQSKRKNAEANPENGFEFSTPETPAAERGANTPVCRVETPLDASSSPADPPLHHHAS